MSISSATITRRQTLAGLGAGAALLALPTRAVAQAVGPTPDPAALLDEVAWNLLAHEPERATTLGVDTDAHAALRGRIENQSAAGQQAYAATLRADLERVRAVDTAPLDAATRTSFEVVESAYATALDGFAQPYGDVAVGSWRNAPYVVIQNVGGYIDVPRFLDSDHPVRDEADAEAYLSRLEAFPTALEGELDRIRAAAGHGRAAAGVPARQGDPADGSLDRRREGRRDAGRIAGRAAPPKPRWPASGTSERARSPPAPSRRCSNASSPSSSARPRWRATTPGCGRARTATNGTPGRCARARPPPGLPTRSTRWA